MAEYTYTRLGMANFQDNDTEALFRDKFIPYLLTTFDQKRVLKGKVRNKTITSGKSASFPLFGTVSAKYLGFGEKLIGNQKMAKAETTIFVDPYLVSDVVIEDLEEKMSETEDREIIAEEMARALANEEDKQLLQVGVLAARHESLIVDENRGGSIVYRTDSAYNPEDMASALFEAGVKLDEKDVDEEGRMAFIRPFQYSLLAQYYDVNCHDIGAGSYSKGTTGRINNIEIIKTNHLPQSNILQDENAASPKNVYYGDFTRTAGLVMTKDAIATVTLANLITEVSWNPSRLHHLLTARIAQGHGILRPECAVEIQSDSLEQTNDEETAE